MRFLVIDDDTRDLERIQRLLKSSFPDATIAFAAVPVAYKNALADIPPNAVLTENQLDWTDGFAVLHDVQQCWRGVPMIMITGMGSEVLAVQAMKSGFADYVPKYDLERLPDAVHASLVPPNDGDRGDLEKRVEEYADELCETLEKYRTLFDAFPLGISISNSEGRVVEVNHESERLLGLTADEHQSRQVNGKEWEIVRPDGTLLPPEEYASTRALLDQKVVRDVEMGVRRPNGEIIWLNVTAAPLSDRRVVIAYADVTDRKRAEAAARELNTTLEARVAERTAALRESEERFRALLTATSYVIYRMSPDWTEMRKLEGRGFLEDTDAPSANWVQQYILPEDQAHVLSVIEEAIRTKSIFQLEHRVRSADGTIGWTYSRAVPLLNERDEIVDWFGAASDITDRKRAEAMVHELNATLEARVAERTAELEALNKTNRILLQEVNHRVKNTLTAILGLILSEKGRLERDVASGSEPMRGQIALSNLYERVRSLATVHGMLSSGQWRPLRVDVLVDEIVRESLPYYVAQDSGHLLLEVTGEHVYVTPEQAHHLALVIGELATNTVKHGWHDNKLRIIVDIGLVDGDVRVVYRNSGPEYPEHILKGEGYSVGLSIVNGVATHSLRGSWAVWNDGGAVAEIRFPVDEELNRRIADER